MDFWYRGSLIQTMNRPVESLLAHDERRNGFAAELCFPDWVKFWIALILISPRDMSSTQRIASVHLFVYKIFRDFSLALQRFNILVGPNNCGKSTILGAFAHGYELR
jgi:hypothetical protein